MAIRPIGGRGQSQKAGLLDSRLKQLMKELGESINNTLSDSDKIAESISQIKAEGYDVFLVLEATIGFNRRDDAAGPEGEQPNTVTIHEEPADLKVSPQDLRFLKSLRITLDDAA